MSQNKLAMYARGAAVLGLIVFLPAANDKNGCGSEEANTTLTSPVQAVTTLLEGADGTVTAELVLISTAVNPHQFVDSAENVSVRVPGGAQVPLTLSSPGHYTATSNGNPELVYTAGETYRFSFDLDDEAAAKKVNGGNFVAVMDAPDVSPAFTIDEAPEFANDTGTISWTPSSKYGLVTITDSSGAIHFQNFDFLDATFSGDKWARLERTDYEFNVDVFSEAGDYDISVCLVDKVSDFDTSLSAELGALSGFLIGRCTEAQTVTIAP